jgi:hypothetical protein
VKTYPLVEPPFSAQLARIGNALFARISKIYFIEHRIIGP